MSRIRSLILLLGLALIIGFCKHEKTANKEPTSATERSSECQELIDEIITPFVVKENTVVFLALSQLEYDIKPNDLKFEIIEVVDDFYAYEERAIDKIAKHGISDLSTISKNLVFLYSDGKEDK